MYRVYWHVKDHLNGLAQQPYLTATTETVITVYLAGMRGVLALYTHEEKKVKHVPHLMILT